MSESKSRNHVMVIGEKESFLIRVLLKKMKDADIGYDFVTMDIDAIAQHWEGTEMVVLYLDTDTPIKQGILSFLDDRLTETGRQLMAIGSEEELARVKERIHRSHLYNIFDRPLDTEQFMNSLSVFLKRMEAGEFRKCILVVDDNPSYLNLVRDWLRYTYKVAVVNSGLQAIKWLGKNKADLILLDYEMPVTSGPQVLEMLRSDNDTKDIPVMFLTGKSDRESVMQVVALKPEGYLLKNILREELIEKLGNFFLKNIEEN